MKLIFASAVYFMLLSPAIPTENSAQMTYKVIVHQENPLSSLSPRELSDIFLKRLSLWKKGQQIMPVELPESSATREIFSKEIHKKSTARIKFYWQKKIFSGRDLPPAEKSSDEKIIEFVRENPHAIGYISGNTIPKGVKILEIKNK